MALPNRVLVATDFSSSADQACLAAIELAGLGGAELHFVHAIEHLPAMTRPSGEALLTAFSEGAEKYAHRVLEDWTRRAQESGLEAHRHLVDLSPAEGVGALARDIGADCVVLGTSGHGRARQALLGSTAERIIRDASCNVLVVRGDRSPFSNGWIVLGDDLGDTSEHVRLDAVALARSLHTGIAVVHAVDLGLPYLASLARPVPGTSVQLAHEAALACLEEIAGHISDVEIENTVVSESAAEALCEQAAKRDSGIVVIGSHGRRGVGTILLGSIAERVARNAPCSVLIVR